MGNHLHLVPENRLFLCFSFFLGILNIVSLNYLYFCYLYIFEARVRLREIIFNRCSGRCFYLFFESSGFLLYFSTEGLAGYCFYFILFSRRRVFILSTVRLGVVFVVLVRLGRLSCTTVPVRGLPGRGLESLVSVLFINRSARRLGAPVRRTAGPACEFFLAGALNSCNRARCRDIVFQSYGWTTLVFCGPVYESFLAGALTLGTWTVFQSSCSLGWSTLLVFPVPVRTTLG